MLGARLHNHSLPQGSFFFPLFASIVSTGTGYDILQTSMVMITKELQFMLKVVQLCTSFDFQSHALTE